MGLKKKTRPGIATAKPTKAEKAPKYTRTPSVPKVCCGALRGHKPDCTGSAAEDLFDGGPEPKFLADVVPEVVEETANAVTVVLLGIEQALVRLADSVDDIKVIIGSRANAEERLKAAEPSPVQATPPRVRKAKAEPAPVAAAPLQSDDPSPVDPTEPDPAPPKAKPAPAVKAVPVTLEEVRSAFLAFASKKGRDEAVAILGRFGAPKVGDLPAAQYPAFLSALKGA